MTRGHEFLRINSTFFVTVRIMPQAVLDLLENFMDLSTSVNFNGEEMTWRELLSSATGMGFLLNVVGIPIILFEYFVWKGRKHRRYDVEI